MRTRAIRHLENRRSGPTGQPREKEHGNPECRLASPLSVTTRKDSHSKAGVVL